MKVRCWLNMHSWAASQVGARSAGPSLATRIDESVAGAGNADGSSRAATATATGTNQCTPEVLRSGWVSSLRPLGAPPLRDMKAIPLAAPSSRAKVMEARRAWAQRRRKHQRDEVESGGTMPVRRRMLTNCSIQRAALLLGTGAPN